MELEQIWANYLDRMSEIELLHRAAKDSANKALKLISEYAELLQENKELKKLPESVDNMFFRNAITGELIFYDQAMRSPEERSLHVLLHKNKQYQWLLAEAYEEFKDFLENLYAYYGSINHAFWPLSDFGSISLPELGGKDYSWFLDKAKNKRDRPKSILNRFRQQFPELRSVESNNKFKVNLSLVVALIEKLRHTIVHTGGTVKSKTKFIDSVAKTVGVYNNGKICQKHVDLVDRFFGKNQYSNLITILEVRLYPETPLDIHRSLFGELTDYLMAYAFLLYGLVEREVGETQKSP